jgi:hypothetical protein
MADQLASSVLAQNKHPIRSDWKPVANSAKTYIRYHFFGLAFAISAKVCSTSVLLVRILSFILESVIASRLLCPAASLCVPATFLD